VNTNSPSRFRQFGLRTLLIAVAVSAITLAVGMAVYTNLVPRKVAIGAIHILVKAATPQSDRSAAREFVRELDPITLSEWLLGDPSFWEIPAVQAEADPKPWLIAHLRVREIERDDIGVGATFVDVRFVIAAKSISQRDLTAIVNKSAEAIQANAEDTNLKAVIVDRQSFSFFDWQ
jgi:hypothetical protein